MTLDEILKTGLVFAHFVASAVALAAILRADFLILLRFNSALSPKACARIRGVKSVVSAALMVLWVTGLAICLQGYLQGPAYLMNQKLWMKVLVVLVLSVNGLFLHRFAFRFIRPGVCLADVALRHRVMMTGLAGLSSGSWLFACFLGIARALNNKPNLGELLGVYASLLSVVLVSGLLVTHLLVAWRARGFPVSSRLSARLLAWLQPDADAGRESELRI